MNVDGVEAVVDREHQVLLDGAHRDRIGSFAGRLVEVGGGVAQRRVGLDDRQPPAAAVQRRQHRRHDRRQLQRLGAAGVVVEIDQRPQPEHRRPERQHRAQLGERLPADRRRGVDDRDEFGGDEALGGDRAGELVGLVGRRQASLVEQEPHLLERVRPGERGRVEPAVVVEALVAADVADRRVGDGDAVEPRGYFRSVRSWVECPPVNGVNQR